MVISWSRPFLIFLNIMKFFVFERMKSMWIVDVNDLYFMCTVHNVGLVWALLHLGDKIWLIFTSLWKTFEWCHFRTKLWCFRNLLEVKIGHIFGLLCSKELKSKPYYANDTFIIHLWKFTLCDSFSKKFIRGLNF